MGVLAWDQFGGGGGLMGVGLVRGLVGFVGQGGAFGGLSTGVRPNLEFGRRWVKRKLG
jgi:hypothetical protein